MACLSCQYWTCFSVYSKRASYSSVLYDVQAVSDTSLIQFLKCINSKFHLFSFAPVEDLVFALNCVNLKLYTDTQERQSL